MVLFLEGLLLPRTHRMDRDRLRQNCTLEFPWEVEPLARGTGQLQVKCVWKVLHGLHLHTAFPSSCNIQCWHPNSSLSTVLLENSVKFCNISGSLWVSLPCIFSAFVAKGSLIQKGGAVTLQKRPDNWFYQESISPGLCCACTQLALNSILEP